jgi:hypothetical protein
MGIGTQTGRLSAKEQLAIKVMELILLGYVSHFLTVFIKHFYFP